jgi:hypothetical protein
VVQQEPALAGSSQAAAVEIPDDDAPPPGWDQWASLGARWTVGRPHGGWGLGPWRRGFFFPRRPPSLGRGACHRAAPLFADAQEEQQLWEELRDHGASLNRALNEALRIHGGPAWHVFQVR